MKQPPLPPMPALPDAKPSDRMWAIFDSRAAVNIDEAAMLQMCGRAPPTREFVRKTFGAAVIVSYGMRGLRLVDPRVEEIIE